MAIVAPSILAADFAHLGAAIAATVRGGAAVIHVDVMDGHFVPNLSMGPAVVEAVRRVTELPIDVHLMVERAEMFIEDFRNAGADWISVHVEGAAHLQRSVARIRELGASPGVVVNPATPIGALDDIIDEVDYVLVMSVNPGFGGQAFLPRTLAKLRRLREFLRARGVEPRVEVDGGVGARNARAVVDAGADVLVAGSAVFGSADIEANTRRLLELANGVAP